MSIKNLVLILAIVGNSANVWANENAAPPFGRSIHNGNKQTIFSNAYLLGKYDKASRVVELTFKQNIDNVEVIIYKDGSVCEKVQEQNIQKEDFFNYILAQYGAGNYTICVMVNGNLIVEKEISINE